MQRNPHVAALLATEGFTAAASGDNHIYMRSTFRNSPSKLKYIIVALYILWMQKYIRGVGPSGAEIAEENPVPLGRNVAPLDVLV
jgi:hypothetical protein